MATLYGLGGSPFVRKVRVLCAEKDIAYDQEPVFGPQVDRTVSPLGKIPAWRDEHGTLADSSVICAYLERVRPEPPLYPHAPRDYARALWFEEYGDGALAPIFGAKIFFRKIVAPRFLGQPVDEAAIEQAWRDEVPPLLDYLESQVTDGWLVGDRFTIADIGIGTQFVNLHHAGYRTDPSRWPRLAAYIDRVHARPSFATLIAEDQAFLGR